MKTAGQLLAEMMQAEQLGEDASQIQREFIQQSRRQLGNACTDFFVAEGVDMQAGEVKQDV